MKRLGWVLSVFVAWAGWVPAARADFAAQELPDRLIVMFKEGVSASDQARLLEQQGLSVKDEIAELRMVLAESKPGAGKAAFRALAARPEVARVGHDIYRNWIESEVPSLQATPLPTVESVMRGLPKPAAARSAAASRSPRAADSEVPWGVARVNAPAAWARTQGAGVKVAVIDTGIDPNQPDLQGKIGGGANFVDKNAPWHDDHFHGTHVAGTIAAALDSKGVAGVAPKAQLFAVKVLSKDGAGNLFSIIQGIMWCAQNGMNVANMSLGAPQQIPLLDYALRYALGAGVTVVAAAGNDGQAVNWPAAYEEAIAVSALCPPGVTNTKLCPTASEGIATFSSRGPEVDFIAPGVLIPSTVPLSHDASGVKAYSGTSMATPHVAGLAALAVAKGATTPDQVRAALKAAATGLPGMSASEQGAGLIDASRLAR